MRRLLAVGAGLLLGFVASGTVLGAGTLVEVASAPLSTSRALMESWAVFLAFLDAGRPEQFIGMAATVIWRAVVTICFVPLCIVAVLGEVLGWRSLPWYAGATGALCAAIPLAMRLSSGAGSLVAPGETRLLALLFLVGAAGGFAYWLLAGWRPAVGVQKT